jgi:cellulose 1,4-beta-cellobiosidase
VAALTLSACAHAPTTPATVTPATGPHAPDGVNPFEGARMYSDPEYTRTLEALAARTPAQAAALRKAANFPVAIWLDKIERTKHVGEYLDDAAKQQQAGGGQPVVPIFVVYDLPNRDCAAEASNGELKIDGGGEARYQREYIDVIAAQFQAHPSLRIVAVVEPDSLANIATNMANEKCAVVDQVYKRANAYAIAKLSLPNVFLYMDAAHTGWLGWPKNLKKIVPIYKEVLDMAGGPDRIRGFAVNVSNYDPVMAEDRRRADPSYPPPDELGYVEDLAHHLDAAGIKNKGFLVDTSRNGRANIRTTPGNWCNIKGAGLGERPRVAPKPLVDAYVWIKTPGQSDGTANDKAARFDPNCASDDATPGAPEAGEWFESYLLDLVKNANPPL